MKHRTHLFIVFMFLLTVCSYAATLPTYDVVELPLDNQVEYHYFPYAINNNRQIVGTDLYGRRAFLYENGEIKYLDGIVGNYSDGADINEIGQITGRAVGYGWILYNGELTRLNNQDGYMFTPLEINNKGQIAGYFYTPDEKRHAVLWENGVVKDLGAPEGSSSTAFDINDKGQIVGFYTTEVDGKEISRVFLYENGNMHDLNIEGVSYDINESGQFFINKETLDGHKTIIWDNGEIIDTDIQNAYAIGENGQVISLYGDIWTKESGTVSIYDLIPEQYRNKFRIFNCINAKGEMIFEINDEEDKIIHALLVPSTQQAVIPPLFSYKSSLYSKPIQVKITCATENAVIHYTTNGVDPTEADPTVVSGGTVLIDKDTVLKAKAWRSDCKASSVRQSEYLIRQKTWKGLAMVSVPTTPTSEDPKLAVGFSNNYWYAYNPSAKVYTGYPDQYTWFDLSVDNYLGDYIRGFWAKFNTETPVPEGKYDKRNRYYVAIDLKPGWNMIGQPFISAFKWDTTRIDVSANNMGFALKNAGEYVQPFIWGWKQSVVNPNTGTYYRVGDPSVYPDAVDTMEPFEGYWIKAKKECTLQLPGLSVN
ncbi:MAG: chitobiase/beta-hexosaminidase C-terminal domain-containing protein [Armatimonadota bacterium]